MKSTRQRCAKCRKSVYSFICLTCRDHVLKQCLGCHKNGQHGGRRFALGVECPHCGKNTKAPTPKQWAVFVRTEVFRQPDAQVASAFGFGNPNWVRTIKEDMPHLGNHCQGRLFPRTDDLRIYLFRKGYFRELLGDAKYELLKDEMFLSGRRKLRPTLPYTARHFDITVYKLNKIIKEVESRYGEAIWQFKVQGTLLRDLPSFGPNPAEVRHPKVGYGWQRDGDSGNRW